MKLSEICIRRPVLTVMMNLGLILFGVIGLSRLPVRELPDIDPPVVNVQTVYPGASAAVVETQVTELIEEALTSVEGIKTLTSESREQSSSITIEFNLSRDVDVAAQDVRDRVSRVRGQLPEDIDEPIVSKQDADARPSLWVALYSDQYSTLELTTLAENMIKDRLQTVPGVSSVILGGAKRFAIRLWLDAEKMAARGVTVLDVQNALKTESLELPSGRVEGLQREMSIETYGQLKSPEEYNNLVIKQQGANFVKLRDIGRAEVGVEDERAVARYNAKPALGLGIVKQSKANIIDVAKGVKAELARITPLLPKGVVTRFAYDESVYIEKSIKEVWITLALAFLLVVLTIYIFLHTFRATFVPGITIPVSIIATFAVLYVMGFSINIVTMLAFVLAIGVVVDDAIVVLENIHRHIEEGLKPMAAAITGMREIGFAVIATTVTLVAVFLPMAFQTTDTGRLFIEFAIAISFSVIISSFVALTLAPMISARWLKSDVHDKRGFVRGFEWWMKGQQALYSRMLNWSLHHKTVIIALSLITLLGAVFFYSRLENEFLPDEDKGRLLCMVIAPEGATSEYTDRMVRKVEAIVSERPEVEGFFAAVALSRGGPGKGSEGLSFIRLKDDGKRMHVRDIVGGPGGLRGKFFQNIEGALVIPIIPKAIGRGFSQPFQLVLQGQDLEKLNDLAQTLTHRFQQEGFLMNVRSAFEMAKPELRVHINRDRASALGVTVEDISRTLQILFGGQNLAKVNLSGKEYDVIVQLARASRLSPDQLQKLYIRNAKGQLIQLSNVVDYEIKGGPSAINHYDRFRSATVEGTPVDIPLGVAVQRAEAILKEELPADFRYDWTGEVSDLKDSGKETLFVILLALLVIYMVLAAQFESLVDPFVIMLSIPLAACGAFGSLWLLALADGFAAAHPGGPIPRIPAMSINLFSQIGLVMLIGVVTKNGILLVEFANQKMAQGKEALEAMREAARIRFRPILMTAFSTIAGILPIAIGFGAGAESRRPLGVVVVGGLATSTFLTLFLVPTVYVIFKQMAHRRREAKTKTGASALVLLLAALTLTGSGCALGPRYQRVALQVPETWKLGEATEQWKKAEPQDQTSRLGWWEIFHDAKLNALEQQAVDNNQNLRRAAANAEKARALARVAKSDLFPEVSFNPDVTRSRRTKNSLTGAAAASGSYISNHYTVPFDLSYEVDLWGRVRRAFEAGRAEAQAAYFHSQSVLLSVTTEVARYYFALRELDRELEIIDKTIELRTFAREVVDQRVTAGITGELDLNRAKTELAKAKTNRVTIQRQRAQLENTLAVLCGQAASGFSLDQQPLDGPVPTVPVAVPSALLERRPDIAEAERQVQAANARIGAAKAAFFPVLNLTGSAGYESVSSGNLFNWESRVWSIGPGVELPIFNFGRNKARLTAALEDYNGSVADYRQTVLTAFGETETALHDLFLGAREAEAQSEALQAARDAAGISIERYKQGLVTFLEVIDAERTRLDAELEATRILSMRLAATIDLIKALGGGW